MTFIFFFIIYMLIGALAGFSGGLLGLGGGVIIVPLLLWILPMVGIPADLTLHIAIGTSLATVMFTFISAVRMHLRRQKNPHALQFFWRLLPSIIGGALLGGLIAHFLPPQKLTLFFGIVIWLLAARSLFFTPPKLEEFTREEWKIPNRFALFSWGLLLNSISTLMGLGGGVLWVPFLNYCQVPTRYAITISSLNGLAMAIAGSAIYMVIGYHATLGIARCTGYIYWPAFFGVILTGMFFAQWGAKAAYRMPARVLRIVFVSFMTLIGFRMIFLS